MGQDENKVRKAVLKILNDFVDDETTPAGVVDEIMKLFAAESDQSVINTSQELYDKLNVPSQGHPPERLFYVSPEMAMILAEEIVRSFGVPRAPGWGKFRDEWIKDYPQCAVCATRRGCVPHHIEPVHISPSKELDRNNLITLCPPHHLIFGHLMNWRSYNLSVRHDVSHWCMKIAQRPRTYEGDEDG